MQHDYDTYQRKKHNGHHIFKLLSQSDGQATFSRHDDPDQKGTYMPDLSFRNNM